MSTVGNFARIHSVVFQVNHAQPLDCRVELPFLAQLRVNHHQGADGLFQGVFEFGNPFVFIISHCLRVAQRQPRANRQHPVFEVDIALCQNGGEIDA